MSTKRGGRNKKRSSKNRYKRGYVLSEKEIGEFVASLGVSEIEAVATRLQAVADATGRILEQRLERLNPEDLKLILRIATESKNKRYQRLMRTIVANVGQGPDGIKAAHLTASRAVEMAFKWTGDYISALKAFEERLRDNRILREARQSSAQTPRLHLASNPK